jgi:hypothetical protein
MSQNLVTVATFNDSVTAGMARNLLEDAGIQAFVADEEIIGMDWVLANAVGRIKLQVGDLDAANAREILRDHDHITDSIAQEITFLGSEQTDDDVEDDDEEDDEFEPEPTRRERNAERAFRGAIFGILFTPIQLYVTYLLILVWFSDEPLAAREHRHAIIAALINIPLLLGLAIVTLGFALR